jgi:hypothetical protein
MFPSTGLYLHAAFLLGVAMGLYPLALNWTRGNSTGDSSFGHALGYIWLCLAVACACWPDAGLLSAERACNACLIHNSWIVPVAILVRHA